MIYEDYFSFSIANLKYLWKCLSFKSKFEKCYQTCDKIRIFSIKYQYI